MRELSSKRNIILMGFMGTGKSSVGKRLANLLNHTFVDSDTEVEKLMNMSISEIFDRYGEIRFRSEENLAIRKQAARSEIVLATGGGAVLNPENLALLKQNGVLITLTATPEVIAARTARKSNRPLLKRDGSVEAIRQLLNERQFAYSQGDIKLDTTLLSLDEVTHTLVSLLKEKGYGESKS
jgi:shikimate kinase